MWNLMELQRFSSASSSIFHNTSSLTRELIFVYPFDLFYHGFILLSPHNERTCYIPGSCSNIHTLSRVLEFVMKCRDPVNIKKIHEQVLYSRSSILDLFMKRVVLQRLSGSVLAPRIVHLLIFYLVWVQIQAIRAELQFVQQWKTRTLRGFDSPHPPFHPLWCSYF